MLCRAAVALPHRMFERLGIRFGVVAAGVDVFSVISGFIILPSLTARPMPAGAFL